MIIFGRTTSAKLLFVFFFLIPLLTACPGRTPDGIKPELKLEGELTRTISANNAVIEGQLSDNLKVTSFSYILNSGESQDAMAAVAQNGTFKFTVENLRFGTNTVVMTAKDAGNNIVKTKVTLTATFYANVSGLWGDQTTSYRVCGETIDIALALDLEQSANTLTGSATMGFAGDNSTGVFQGSVNASGVVVGTAKFEVPEGTKTGNANFRLSDGKLTGTLTFKGTNGVSCDGETYQDVILRGDLEKDVDVPAPAEDDALEPNDNKTQATPIQDGFSQDLKFTYLNFDYFTFTVDKPQQVKVNLTNELGLYGSYLSIALFDKQSNHIKENNEGTTYTWTVSPGTYYLMLNMSIYEHPEVDYTLEFNLEDVPN